MLILHIAQLNNQSNNFKKLKFGLISLQKQFIIDIDTLTTLTLSNLFINIKICHKI